MWAVAIVMAVSAAAQYYQAQKARGANQAELKKIKDLFNSLTPPGYDKTIDDPPDVHKNELALPKYQAAMAQPSFSTQQLIPHALKQVAQFSPEMAQYVHEQAPQLLNESADMKTGRDAQLRALERYKQVGSGEFDPGYQGMVTDAAHRAQQEAQSANDSVLQSAARRGMQNSGLTMALQGQASAQSMDRLANTNLNAASQAYQNRLNALASGASLGGQVRGQDVDLQSRNADIINSFNQRMQAGQQGIENQRSGAINQGRMYNLGEQQRIFDANAQTQNAYDQGNQARRDDLTKYGYQARLGERNRADQISAQQYQDQVGQLNQNNNIAQQLAEFRDKQRQEANTWQARGFQDQVQKAGGQATPMNMQIGMNNQHAADTNNALQGLSNIASMYGQSSMQQDYTNQQNANDANLAHYRQTGSYFSPEDLAAYRENGTLPSKTAPPPGGTNYGYTPEQADSIKRKRDQEQLGYYD